MSTLQASIRRNGGASSWARWLVDDESSAAIDCREFLERALAEIQSTIRHRLLRRIESGDAAQLDSVLHEVAAYELLRLLGLAPEMDPPMRTGQTPDLALTIDNQRFAADVFVTHSPQPTSGDSANGIDWARDSGERARKIAERISEKSTKYRALGLPVIQLVFLGDHLILSLQSIEAALYGVALSEFEPGDLYPGSFHFAMRCGGILLPDNGRFPHTHLSAVVAIDWFDSLSRERPGKRFACRILSHPEPSVPIKRGGVHPFQEIHWCSCGPNAWQPDEIGDPCIVARCGTEPPIEFGCYTAECPW